ncbi:Endonuclease/exonuclease/phosphatase [Paraphysoderma sedebokerense]|nr:Endonuclease/exonuclease/phosphatase [Paraphysoderma sedebokerense]
MASSIHSFSLTTDRYDLISVPEPAKSKAPEEYLEDLLQSENEVIVHPCTRLQKFLSSGTFYFSSGGSGFDLSRCAQSRYAPESESTDTTSGVIDASWTWDKQYIWNYKMLKELIKLKSTAAEVADMDMDGVPFIQGYVGINKYPVSNGAIMLAVISRVNHKRAGTRYLTRGIDDFGHVANFVETEMLLYFRNYCFSYVQTRGSVPVFWEQPGIQMMGHKIQISRGPEATRPAFERHFKEAFKRYGHVHAVNLLSQDAPGESTLAIEYRQHVAFLNNPSQLSFIDFDFHAECKGTNYAPLQVLIARLRNQMEQYGYFLVDTETSEIVMTQRGVFRTNCLDCLDRTNVVQGLLAEKQLKFLESMDDKLKYLFLSEGFQLGFKDIWADNGDYLSRIYAGTGALKSGFTRSGKRTIAGLLDDTAKSVNRFVKNNFQDKTRLEIIDTLLCKAQNQQEISIYDPVTEEVNREMKARSSEFTSEKRILVHVGSYNVNGKLPEEDITSWLSWSGESRQPDVYAIGFQEIVELTPGQIVAADPAKRQQWENVLIKTVNRLTKQQYVTVKTGQLVGAAIIILVKADLTPYIRHVEMNVTKTGLRGMAGNKGGISVRMDIWDSSFCFVTAHLAAGQSNVDERNRDYQTITTGTLFSRGKKIKDHENIFWLGDFNYRISMENEQCRALIGRKDWNGLFMSDQLNHQMRQGAVFKNFKEGVLSFPPTYKYDNGTDIYDTSEKNRIPAWCDRVLYCGQKIQLLNYGRAELKVSDHKPVKATFEVSVSVIDHVKKSTIYQGIYRSKTTGLSKAAASTTSNSAPYNPFESPSKNAVKESLLIDFEDSSTLPPPSSDTQKWWYGPERSNGFSTSSNVQPVTSTFVQSTTSGSNPPVLPPRQNRTISSSSEDPFSASATVTSSVRSMSLTSNTNSNSNNSSFKAVSSGSLAAQSSSSISSASTSSKAPPPIPPRTYNSTSGSASSLNSAPQLDPFGFPISSSSNPTSTVPRSFLTQNQPKVGADPFMSNANGFGDSNNFGSANMKVSQQGQQQMVNENVQAGGNNSSNLSLLD